MVRILATARLSAQMCNGRCYGVYMRLWSLGIAPRNAPRQPCEVTIIVVPCFMLFRLRVLPEVAVATAYCWQSVLAEDVRRAPDLIRLWHKVGQHANVTRQCTRYTPGETVTRHGHVGNNYIILF